MKKIREGRERESDMIVSFNFVYDRDKQTVQCLSDKTKAGGVSD